MEETRKKRKKKMNGELEFKIWEIFQVITLILLSIAVITVLFDIFGLVNQSLAIPVFFISSLLAIIGCTIGMMITMGEILLKNTPKLLEEVDEIATAIGRMEEIVKKND